MSERFLTMPLDRFCQRMDVLDRYITASAENVRVELVINGTAYPVSDIWVMSYDGKTTLCIGEDPR